MTKPFVILRQLEYPIHKGGGASGLWSGDNPRLVASITVVIQDNIRFTSFQTDVALKARRQNSGAVQSRLIDNHNCDRAMRRGVKNSRQDRERLRPRATHLTERLTQHTVMHPANGDVSG
jgi:hypothetical protein